jgi:hypothetical protein
MKLISFTDSISAQMFSNGDSHTFLGLIVVMSRNKIHSNYCKKRLDSIVKMGKNVKKISVLSAIS